MTKVYQDTLPSGLPEGIKTEAQLWDEIIKKMVYVAPHQLFPLIKEVHGKSYPPNTSVVPLATEYSITRSDTNEVSSIRSDVTVLIARRDIYHFECEISFDGMTVMRMFEYDTHIALTYADTQDAKVKLTYPRSTVLYLQGNKNLPDELVCELQLPDGTTCNYKVPTLKVQSYTLDDIRKKHLSILIPFLPLRFRPMLKRKNYSQETFLNELTSFYEQIILILEDEMDSKFLSINDCKSILNLLQKSFIRVTQTKPDLQQEVLKMTPPILELEHEKNERLEKELAQMAEEKQQMAIKNQQMTIMNQQMTIMNQQITAENDLLQQRIAELEKALAKQ